jgi:hypothetical protein
MTDFYCQECGYHFKTLKAAEKASFGDDGCPKCGGSDVDIGRIEQSPALDRQCHEWAQEGSEAAASVYRFSLNPCGPDPTQFRARKAAYLADRIIAARTAEAKASDTFIYGALRKPRRLRKPPKSKAEVDANMDELAARIAAQADFNADAKAAADELVGADIWNAAEAAQEV